MFRKILLVFLSASLLITVSACRKRDTDLSCVSDLVSALYTGENASYRVTVSAGKRESPFLADGKTGDLYPLFSVRLTPLSPCSEGEEFSVSVTVNGRTFAEKARFSPAATYLFCNLNVSENPPDDFWVTIYRNGESQSVEMHRILTDVSPKSAIAAAREALKGDLSPYHLKGKFTGEIHARLTAVESSVYWFISFIPENGESLSALVDGKTGAVLAVKGAGGKPA